MIRLTFAKAYLLLETVQKLDIEVSRSIKRNEYEYEYTKALSVLESQKKNTIDMDK